MRYAARLFVPSLALMLVGTGCTWVSSKTFEDKRSSLDEDGDGCPKSTDCDDDNPFECVLFVEVPYDGWDNDCTGGDVVDVDGDGIPGILKADWDARNTDSRRADWPGGAQEDAIDCRDVSPDQLETFVFIDVSLTEEELETAGVSLSRADFDEVVAPWTQVSHANASEIKPLAPDSPYDGIDHNCDGENDFDQDADGYMPTEYQQAFEDWKTEWGYTYAEELFGDCKDQDVNVNPGITEDPWYDGVDQDCAGNNDFDQDGDTYIPYFIPGTETASQDLYDAYVEIFHPDGVPWTESWNSADSATYDCLDLPHPYYTDVLPETVYPGAIDTPYDGIDSDCGYDNDFDVDGDGHRPDLGDDDAAYTTYLTEWSTVSFPTTAIPSTDPNDCADDEAEVFPGALETLADAFDQDCDGNSDTTPFGFDLYTWGEPRRPVIGATTDYYLLTASTEYLDTQVNTRGDSALTLLFDLSPGYQESPAVQPQVWQGSGQTFPVGYGVDMITNLDEYYTALSYFRTDNQQTYLFIKKFEYNPVNGLYNQSFAYRGHVSDETYEDIDLKQDDGGNVWALGCGPTTVQFITANESEGTFKRDIDAVSTGVTGGDSCFLDVPNGAPNIAQGTVCDGTDCITYDLDITDTTGEITESSSQPWAGRGFRSTVTTGDWLIAANKTTGLLIHNFETGAEQTLFSSDAIRHGDLMEFGNVTYVIAIRESNGNREVLLAYGDLSGTLTEVVLPFEGVDSDGDFGSHWLPEATSIWVDSDRVAIAVNATHEDGNLNEDAIGWLFLGSP